LIRELYFRDNLDIMLVWAKEFESYRMKYVRRFFIFFIIFSFLAMIIEFSIIFWFFFFSQKYQYDREAKMIFFNNVKFMRSPYHSARFIRFDSNEKDFYSFCSSIWEFDEYYQQKMELFIDDVPIVVAEIELKKIWRDYKGRRKENIIFNGTIIKIYESKSINFNNIQSKKLPLKGYSTRISSEGNRKVMYIITDDRLLFFDLIKNPTREYVRENVGNFLDLLVSIIY